MPTREALANWVPADTKQNYANASVGPRKHEEILLNIYTELELIVGHYGETRP